MNENSETRISQNSVVHPATLKVEEAAKVLGIGRQTAYALAREGKLPGALRLGGRIIVSRKMLFAYLEGKEEGSEKSPPEDSYHTKRENLL